MKKMFNCRKPLGILKRKKRSGLEKKSNFGWPLLFNKLSTVLSEIFNWSSPCPHIRKKSLEFSRSTLKRRAPRNVKFSLKDHCTWSKELKKWVWVIGRLISWKDKMTQKQDSWWKNMSFKSQRRAIICKL